MRAYATFVHFVNAVDKYVVIYKTWISLNLCPTNGIHYATLKKGCQMTPARARSGPRKVRLDVDLIVTAGLEVASENPSATFSAKKLGAKLGVDPSAVYRHFPNKGHLMERLLDELHRRAIASIDATPEDWRGQIRQLAEFTLREYTKYPSIAAESMVVTTHGEGELDAVELLLTALSTAGLTGDAVVHHYALLSSFMLSNASGIARSRAESAEEHAASPDGDMPWLDGPILADPRTHPNIALYAVQLATLQDSKIYRLGIESLLDSVEREVNSSKE